jgi:hypothetical protein
MEANNKKIPACAGMTAYFFKILLILKIPVLNAMKHLKSWFRQKKNTSYNERLQ